jgi:hypothetical protein
MRSFMGLSIYNMATAATAMQCISMIAYFNPVPQVHVNNENCIPPDCEYLEEDQLHPREKFLLSDFPPPPPKGFQPSFYEYYFGSAGKAKEFNGSSEYLRFRKDDRDKFLFLSAEYNLHDSLNPKYMLKFLSDINKKFDLKYKVVKTYDEICREVERASKIGKLGNVLIHAPASTEFMCIADDCKGSDGYIYKDKEFLNCFRGLDLSGKITLLGAKAGASYYEGYRDNLAQKMATGAKRTVIAATDSIYLGRTEMPVLDDFEVFHDNLKDKDIFDFFRTKKNIFKIFHPIYSNCVDVFKDKIHDREEVALQTIRDETIKKSTLIQPTEFDDPRQKFLYLSMEADHNGALNPQQNPELFETLSKNYDFKFKVVKSYDELCKEVKEAADTGKLLNLIINGHGNSNIIHIAGPENSWDSYMYRNRDLAKCFDGLDPSATITLFVCSAGEPKNGNLNDNIAATIAKETQKAVVASTEKSFSALRKIVSIYPFEITHPSKNDPNKNIYKTFNP